MMTSSGEVLRLQIFGAVNGQQFDSAFVACNFFCERFGSVPTHALLVNIKVWKCGVH